MLQDKFRDTKFARIKNTEALTKSEKDSTPFSNAPDNKHCRKSRKGSVTPRYRIIQSKSVGSRSPLQSENRDTPALLSRFRISNKREFCRAGKYELHKRHIHYSAEPVHTRLRVEINLRTIYTGNRVAHKLPRRRLICR